MSDNSSRMEGNSYPYKDGLRELYADYSIREGRIEDPVKPPEIYGVTQESIKQLIQERAQGKPMHVYLTELFADVSINNGSTIYIPEKYAEVYGITKESVDELVARKQEEAGKSRDAIEMVDAEEEDLIEFPSEEEDLIEFSADLLEQAGEVPSPSIPPHIMRNFEIGRELVPHDVQCLERAFEDNRRRNREGNRPDLQVNTDAVEPESPCSTSSTPISSPGMRERQEARKAARKAREEAEREAAEEAEKRSREDEMQIERRRTDREAAKLEAVQSVKDFLSAAKNDTFVGALRLFSSSLDFTRNHMKSLIFLGLLGAAGFKAIGMLADGCTNGSLATMSTTYAWIRGDVRYDICAEIRRDKEGKITVTQNVFKKPEDSMRWIPASFASYQNLSRLEPRLGEARERIEAAWSSSEGLMLSIGRQSNTFLHAELMENVDTLHRSLSTHRKAIAQFHPSLHRYLANGVTRARSLQDSAKQVVAANQEHWAQTRMAMRILFTIVPSIYTFTDAAVLEGALKNFLTGYVANTLEQLDKARKLHDEAADIHVNIGLLQNLLAESAEIWDKRCIPHISRSRTLWEFFRGSKSYPRDFPKACLENPRAHAQRVKELLSTSTIVKQHLFQVWQSHEHALEGLGGIRAVGEGEMERTADGPTTKADFKQSLLLRGDVELMGGIEELLSAVSDMLEVAEYEPPSVRSQTVDE